MASTCCQPITDSHLNGASFELNFQFPKPPVPSDATVLGCAARFNIPTMRQPRSMNGHRSQELLAARSLLSSSCTTDSSEDEETSDSGGDGLPSFTETLPRARQVIDLTLDDESDGNDDNVTETASRLLTNTLQPLPSSLRKSPAYSASGPTKSPMVATPGKKTHPWKNVPRWSSLYHKLRQSSPAPPHNPNEFESPLQGSRALTTEESEMSPEIPETPTDASEDIWGEEHDHKDDGEEDHNGRTQITASVSDAGVDRGSSFVPAGPHNEHHTSPVEKTKTIASTTKSEEVPLGLCESSEHTLAPMTAAASSLSNVGDDSAVTVDISTTFTITSIVDKELSTSGEVRYKCELGPQWLPAHLVEKAQTGHVHIRNYENGLVRADRLGRLRKRKLSDMLLC